MCVTNIAGLTISRASHTVDFGKCVTNVPGVCAVALFEPALPYHLMALFLRPRRFMHVH